MQNITPSKTPLVSIVIPAFNCARFITETINSCLNQTLEEIEIVCVDDCSTDGTMEILNAHAQSNSKIRVHRMDTNSKPAAVRNKAISMARGKFILPLDSDDIISHDYIEKALNVFQNNPSIAVVYCKAKYFGDCVDDWDLPPYDSTEILTQNMVHCSAIYRKDDWKQVGGYCEQLIHGREDWDFWLQFVKRGKFFYRIPETLFYYRQLPKSRSSFLEDSEKVSKTSTIIYRRNVELFMKKFKQEGKLSFRMKAKMRLSKLVWQYLYSK